MCLKSPAAAAAVLSIYAYAYVYNICSSLVMTHDHKCIVRTYRDYSYLYIIGNKSYDDSTVHVMTVNMQMPVRLS